MDAHAVPLDFVVISHEASVGGCDRIQLDKIEPKWITRELARLLLVDGAKA